ncbi:HAD family hydrolase [Spiroplasma chinense]|uniref:HAD family hydrolase n=1 Tax=Spiroplasma chinense TaxID=216932 RepID=A0A5B9Y5G0_9MOLU|nr:HAD-IIB family hydrolase [Spiroplasma chinense]QEH62033.1 HAD family hydrolase [Spiroplasma chinense]
MTLPFVASDLDGTIVKNKDFKILDKTIEDILNYQEKSGSKFFIVTGRVFATSKVYINQLNVTLPVVGCNGAAIVDPITREVLFEDVVKKEFSEKIIDFAKENNLDLIFYTATSIVGLNDSERIVTFGESYKDLDSSLRPEMICFENLDELKECVMNGIHKPVKYLFSFPLDGNDKIIDETIKFLNQLDLNCPTTKMGDRFLVDAMNNGINKATGLQKWAEIMDVDINTIHTAGDNNNDIEMTEQSPFGCIVENGVENAKKIAKRVLKHIEDNGVGEYLRELVDQNK